jgi:PAS domain S-box-containing protein
MVGVVERVRCNAGGVPESTIETDALLTLDSEIESATPASPFQSVRVVSADPLPDASFGQVRPEEAAFVLVSDDMASTPDSDAIAAIRRLVPSLTTVVVIESGKEACRPHRALLRIGRTLSHEAARGEKVQVLIDRAIEDLCAAGGYRSVSYCDAGAACPSEGIDTIERLRLPVDVNGHIHGYLEVEPDPSRYPDAEEIALLGECADDIALGIHLEHLDIARQETLIRLLESEERFRQVFHQTNDAVLLYEVNPLGRAHVCLEANDQACRWLGYSPEELRKRSPGELIRCASMAGPLPWDRAEGGPFTFDGSIRRRDGVMTLALFTLHRFPLLGRPVMLVVARDVSEERRLANEQATSLEQIQKNMEQFQILNDQIRNPVQVIIGLADLEGGEFSRQIIRQAREIDDIVRQLDMGWLESAKVSSYLRRYNT